MKANDPATQAKIDQSLARVRARSKASSPSKSEGTSSVVRRVSGKRGAFAIVPESILEDKGLSLDTRAVLAWMHGKPDGWIFKIEVMKNRLGISERVWSRMKKELKAAGVVPANAPHRDGFTWVLDVNTSKYG